MCFSYMHILYFIKEVDIGGCINHPCFKSVRPIFKCTIICTECKLKIDAPVGGEFFSTVAPIVIYEQKCRYLYVLFQMSEKIGKNRNFGAKIGKNRNILKK